MSEFVVGKTYCELCLDQVDLFSLNDGYTTCCNERPIGVPEIKARGLDKEYEEA